jgi:hypothetical protein
MTTDTVIRALWLAVAVLAAALIGTAAGVTSWISSRDAAGALLVGGGAFGGTLLLVLTVIRFVSDHAE